MQMLYDTTMEQPVLFPQSWLDYQNDHIVFVTFHASRISFENVAGKIVSMRKKKHKKRKEKIWNREKYIFPVLVKNSDNFPNVKKLKKISNGTQFRVKINGI